MKKSVSILIAAAIFASAPALKAEPDITDLLKGAAGALKGGSGEGSGSTALSGLKGMVEGLILSQYNAQARDGADYLIVLGAQWKSTGPSEVLRRRLDKAADYLSRNPGTKVIVSGGQGGNEAITEASGMRAYLMDAGIDESRILLEDKSENTYENLVFSGAFLDRGTDNVVVVTNNFHMFRALGIARKQGYTHVEGLAAKSVLGMGPNNLLREFFGVVKDFFVGHL